MRIFQPYGCPQDFLRNFQIHNRPSTCAFLRSFQVHSFYPPGIYFFKINFKFMISPPTPGLNFFQGYGCPPLGFWPVFTPLGFFLNRFEVSAIQVSIWHPPGYFWVIFKFTVGQCCFLRTSEAYGSFDKFSGVWLVNPSGFFFWGQRRRGEL